MVYRLGMDSVKSNVVKTLVFVCLICEIVAPVISHILN